MLQEPPPTGEEPAPTPVWQHEEVTLSYPSARPAAVDIEGAWVLHFDGGCKKGLGAGGFTLHSPDGKCHAGGGWYYGRSCPTNNVAEATTMVRALQCVRRGPWVEHRGSLVVRGDTNLIISFMTKAARPGKRELVVLVKSAQECLRGWGRRV